MDDAVIVRANLAALLSMGQSLGALTRTQAAQIAWDAIKSEADAIDAQYTPEALQSRLTLHGVRAVHEAQAGLIERGELVRRIESLTTQQQAAYSMRYEHGMSDAQIAQALDLSEDEVVSLMLRALLTLTGVRE